MHREWGCVKQETIDRIEACRRRGGRLVAVGTTSVRLLETAAAQGTLKPFAGYTDLFIRPPYQFRTIDALLTNFHLPRTTLLVLVRTFGGDELIRLAYEEAIREQYRFYSYGDAMLILYRWLRKDSSCRKLNLSECWSCPRSCFAGWDIFRDSAATWAGISMNCCGRKTPAIGRGPRWKKTPASSN